MITNPPHGHKLHHVNKVSKIASRSDDPYVKVAVFSGGKRYITSTVTCQCGERFLPGDPYDVDYERHVFSLIWDEAVEECNRYGGLDGFEDEFRQRNPYQVTL